MTVDDLDIGRCEFCGEVDDELTECKICRRLFCHYCGDADSELCFFDDEEDGER